MLWRAALLEMWIGDGLEMDWSTERSARPKQPVRRKRCSHRRMDEDAQDSALRFGSSAARGPKREPLTRQGDHVTRLLLLLEGRVSVYVDNATAAQPPPPSRHDGGGAAARSDAAPPLAEGSKRTRIATLRPFSFIGEVSYIAPGADGRLDAAAGAASTSSWGRCWRGRENQVRPLVS